MKSDLNAAQVGRMFVTEVTFKWHAASNGPWDEKAKKYVPVPGHWDISARLADTAEQRYDSQSMSIKVEQGVGAKLAAILLPVIVEDASRKAQQLADESKALLAALGERCVNCITDMSATEAATPKAVPVASESEVIESE